MRVWRRRFHGAPHERGHRGAARWLRSGRSSSRWQKLQLEARRPYVRVSKPSEGATPGTSPRAPFRSQEYLRTHSPFGSCPCFVGTLSRFSRFTVIFFLSLTYKAPSCSSSIILVPFPGTMILSNTIQPLSSFPSLHTLPRHSSRRPAAFDANTHPAFASTGGALYGFRLARV